MAKEKQNRFAAVLEKFSTHKELESVPIKPSVLDDLWKGFHFGAMYALWGDRGSGKSSITFQVMRSLCRQGKKGVFVDVEKAFNSFQQTSFGLSEFIESGQLLVLTLSDWKEVEEVVMSLEDSDVDFFVIDSISMLNPYLGKEHTVADVRPGIRAQQATHVLTKMKNMFYYKGIGGILLYHARANIQIGGAVNPYAPKDKMAGGFADGHIPDVITKIKAHSQVKGDNDDIIGLDISIVCDKNKFREPFDTRREKLIFGKGIDARVSVIESALVAGIITQGGGTYYLPEGVLPDGSVKVRGRKALYQLDNDSLRRLQEILKSVSQ